MSKASENYTNRYAQLKEHTMNSVFVLQHSYELEDRDEVKFIGVYSSELEAQKAISRLSNESGFKEKIDGFCIDEYELNKDHWTSGFATMTSIQIKNKFDNWVTVSAKCLPNNQYLIVEKYNNNELGMFKDGDIVFCKEENGELYAISKI